MARLLYNLLWPVGLLIFLPNYIVKMFRRGNYAHKFGQRFGIYSRNVRTRLARTQPIWLHAVSVGEVNVAFKLAYAMRALEPDLFVVMTTTTTTGFAVANKVAPDWIEVLYTPLDFWPVMRAAVKTIRPLKLILVEQEIWPNMIAQARARRIPVALVNARLSARAERRFTRFRSIVLPLLRGLDVVCVQFPDDVGRWERLGVARSHIELTGSIKYDQDTGAASATEQRAVLAEMGVPGDAPILVGGSTHRGEDELLARIALQLRNNFPNLFLITVPRHAERAGAVYQSLGKMGLRPALKSGAKPGTNANVLVVDTTGELQHWYQLATIAFIGKSMAANGGQNPVEAILAGAPVIFGPHMENFTTLSESLVASGGALQVSTEAELQDAISSLLRDSELRKTLVRLGREAVRIHQGAASRTARVIAMLARP